MSMMEPFMPHPPTEENVAAADPGAGAPETSPGFGLGGEDPDAVNAGLETGEGDGQEPDSTPFRTPDPDEVRPEQGH